MNLETIITEIRERLGESSANADFWPDTFIIRAVNEAIRRFSAEEKWPWLYTTQTGVVIAQGANDISLVENVALNRHFSLLLSRDSDGELFLPERVEAPTGTRLRVRYAKSSMRPRWFYPTTTRDDSGGDYESIVMGDGPLGYWRLGEAPGSTQALDISGNALHLTQQGVVEFGAPQLVKSDADTAVLFDGIFNLNYLKRDFDPALAVGAPFTVEAWAQGNDSDPNQVCDMLDANKGFEITTAGTPSEWKVRFGNGTGSPYTGDYEVVAGERVHIVGTHDGTTISVYINGQLNATRVAGFIPSDTEPFKVGHDFNGTVDEVAVYNRVLTPNEVVEHYDAGIAGNQYLAQVVRLVPKADTNYTAEYSFFRRPVALSDLNIEPDLPDDYHDAIVARATGMLWLKELREQGKASEQFELYAEILRQARKDMKEQGIDEIIAWGKEEPTLDRFDLRGQLPRHLGA